MGIPGVAVDRDDGIGPAWDRALAADGPTVLELPATVGRLWARSGHGPTDLRHTGAVLATATGANLAELMGRLGHGVFDDHGAVNVVRRRLRSLRSTRLRRGSHDARASTTSSTVSRSRNSAPRSTMSAHPLHTGQALILIPRATDTAVLRRPVPWLRAHSPNAKIRAHAIGAH